MNHDRRPMNDDRINSLLNMAREAELFERDLEGTGASNVLGPDLRLTGARPPLLRRPWVRVGALAAAVALIAAVGPALWHGGTSAGNARSSPVASGPSASDIAPADGVKGRVGQAATPIAATATTPKDARPATPSDDDREQVLIALYRTADGQGTTCPQCWCVQRWTPEMASAQQLKSIAEAELIASSLSRTCVPEPVRMIVVGLSGPSALLPSTDEQARSLALCIAESNGQSTGMPGRPAGAPSVTGSCVENGIAVRLATWAAKEARPN